MNAKRETIPYDGNAEQLPATSRLRDGPDGGCRGKPRGHG